MVRSLLHAIRAVPLHAPGKGSQVLEGSSFPVSDLGSWAPVSDPGGLGQPAFNNIRAVEGVENLIGPGGPEGDDALGRETFLRVARIIWMRRSIEGEQLNG